MSRAHVEPFRTYWNSTLRCVVLDWRTAPRGAELRAGLEAADEEMSRHGSDWLLVDAKLLHAVVELAPAHPAHASDATWTAADEYLEAIGR